MGVISVSLNESNVESLDRIREVYSLGGRSEAVRLAINAALSDIRDMESMDGTVEGVLVIVRGNHADPWMIQIQAKYEGIVKTQLHTHLSSHKCLEVMVISTTGDVLAEMLRDIRAEGKADYVKFV